MMCLRSHDHPLGMNSMRYRWPFTWRRSPRIAKGRNCHSLDEILHLNLYFFLFFYISKIGKRMKEFTSLSPQNKFLQEFIGRIEQLHILFSTAISWRAHDGSSSSFWSGPSTNGVFLNFRGKDTRHNFIGFLHRALKRKRINVFMYDEDL
ncbi:hypothetical protein NE237_032161 [Protea cynaroides]|uniref:TIR domain-containing protein n=1 Tax=Protea cynaroides TaxID=273540 RepID=A0A9Q0L3Q7_9MAGN|nr:hypothetical protein NE237_032161 [Protea cynaroides]